MPSTGKDLDEEQLHYHKLLIDYKEIPKSMLDSLNNTPQKPETLRKAVRYAHERLAEAHADVRTIEEGFARRGIGENDRGYGRQVEEGIERSKHCGDEGWIQQATMAELEAEVRVAAEERKHVEYSANNLRPQLAEYDAIERLRAEGMIHVYDGPGSAAARRLKQSPNSNSSPSSSSEGRGGNAGDYRRGDRGRGRRVRGRGGRYLTSGNTFGHTNGGGSWRGS